MSVKKGTRNTWPYIHTLNNPSCILNPVLPGSTFSLATMAYQRLVVPAFEVTKHSTAGDVVNTNIPRR